MHYIWALLFNRLGRDHRMSSQFPMSNLAFKPEISCNLRRQFRESLAPHNYYNLPIKTESNKTFDFSLTINNNSDVNLKRCFKIQSVVNQNFVK